jgi:hypothetical protein
LTKREKNLDSTGHDTPEEIDEAEGLMEQLSEVELRYISEENRKLAQQANIYLQT